MSERFSTSPEIEWNETGTHPLVPTPAPTDSTERARELAREFFDFIIIGTGAGGGTLALELEKTGKKILILERGTFLPREKDNWETKSVFVNNRYHTTETWLDKNGKDLHPGTGYWVGGNTKVYGAALFRLRKEDFGILQHKDGISPAWPVGYEEFEPYYEKAERLFSVRGKAGLDPTEPPRKNEYPFAAISNEPRMQEIENAVRKLGFKPFPVPLGLKLDERDRVNSQCIRCDTCDGFPCMVEAKSDSEMNCVRPATKKSNVTLVTSAKVQRIVTDPGGKTAQAVEVQLNDGTQPVLFKGSIIVISAGAINSAALLLASTNDRHPKGLANGSDQVGRNFMFHNSSTMLALGTEPNPSRYMKTFGINDFYFGEKDYPYPMGSIQPVGSFKREMLKGDAPPLTPPFVLEMMKTHSVPWWLMTEDLPRAENRIRLNRGRIDLDYTPNNQESFNRLNRRWIEVLKEAGHAQHVFNLHAYLKKYINLEGVGHQNGTCRFGTDPADSVLDTNCKTHEVDNLYVVDSAFFPSCGAVNPSLTIIANAIRVADHLVARIS